MSRYQRAAPVPSYEQRAAQAALAVARAEAELARGCVACGRPWKAHYRRGGVFVPCSPVDAQDI